MYAYTHIHAYINSTNKLYKVIYTLHINTTIKEKRPTSLSAEPVLDGLWSADICQLDLPSCLEYSSGSSIYRYIDYCYV